MEEKTLTRYVKQEEDELEKQKKVSVVHIEMVKEEKTLYGMYPFNTPEKATEMICPLLNRREKEQFLVVSLNARLEPQAIEVVAIGAINACGVCMCDIFKHTILSGCPNIICFHNHPSGNVEPSKEDIQITQRLVAAGEILGISVIDHLIIGDDEFYSFKQKGKMEKAS